MPSKKRCSWAAFFCVSTLKKVSCSGRFFGLKRQKQAYFKGLTLKLGFVHDGRNGHRVFRLVARFLMAWRVKGQAAIKVGMVAHAAQRP
jgi:hypothetical protein